MNIQFRKNGEDPAFARIIIVDPQWERDFSTAQEVLTGISEKWPTGNRVHFIVTSSGFVDFDWEEPDTKILDNWNPDSNFIDKLRLVAEKRCKSLINDELRDKLYLHADYLSIGIDSEKYNKLHYPDCWPFYPHIEFVALINLKNNHYYWTGKSYPQKEQEKGLIRNNNISNHFIDLPQGKILLLACNDLVMEYPRGIKATKTGSPRDRIKKEFELALHEAKPSVVLHHAHTSNDPLIWRTSLNHLQEIEPSVKEFVSVGVFSALCGDESGYRFNKTALKTTNFDTLDFIVTLKDNIIHIPEITSRKPRETRFKQQKEPMNLSSNLARMKEQLSKDEYEIFLKIFQWSEKRKLRPDWSKTGRFYPVFKDDKSDKNNLISIKPNGTVQIELKYIVMKSPFNTTDKKRDLIKQLNSIPGVSIEGDQ